MAELFIRIDDEKEKDIAKLVYFLKNRKKADAFKEAFIIASKDENFRKKYVNQLFISEFNNILKKLASSNDDKGDD